MGNFVIHIEAVGGHGCQREVKHGETIPAACGQPNCPDCMARAFVAMLKRGNSVSKATLTHWPNADGTLKADSVIDDLLTHKRAGSFGVNVHKGESNLPLLAPAPPTENVGPVVDWDAQAPPEGTPGE